MKDWKDRVDFAVTACDADGVITEMNPKACETFAKYGGRELIGKSLLGCHNENSRRKIKELLAGAPPNAYTIEKNGVKKLVYQAPFYENGKPASLVELSFVIPAELPHFVRK